MPIPLNHMMPIILQIPQANCRVVCFADFFAAFTVILEAYSLAAAAAVVALATLLGSLSAGML